MIHPSYVELMKVVNDEGEIGEEPVVNSRYSIVLATAKRARPRLWDVLVDPAPVRSVSVTSFILVTMIPWWPK